MEIFKEKKLDPNFCSEMIKRVKRLIGSSTTFSLIGLPGQGISLFLKYLVCQDFAYFVHVDVYDLTKLDKQSLFEVLFSSLSHRSPKTGVSLIKQCQKELIRLVDQHHRIVIIFNRFDQLKRKFDKELLNNLRALRDIDRQKIVMIFAVNKSVHLLAPHAIDQGNLFMYSKILTLKPYSPTDLSQLLRLDEPQTKISSTHLKKLTNLSGGHYQLFKLLLKSEKQNYLEDPFIRLQLEKINQALTPNQQVTIPLLKQFTKSAPPLSLPLKEAKLFKLLKKNPGSTVSLEEIFQTIWPQDSYEISNWALNSLIYRLRKNLQVNSQKYIIENYKKVGYRLVKI